MSRGPLEWQRSANQSTENLISHFEKERKTLGIRTRLTTQTGNVLRKKSNGKGNASSTSPLSTPSSFTSSPPPSNHSLSSILHLRLCTATAFRFQSRSSLKRNKNRQNNTRNEFTLPIHKILPAFHSELDRAL